MPRLLSVFLSALICLTGCAPHDQNIVNEKNIYRDTSDHGNYNVRIKVSNRWIEKIRRFDYSRNTKGLLHEFEGFIKPDTMINPGGHHIDEDYGRVLNPMFINLDGEPGEELICLLAWDVGSPYLGLFKQLKGQWYLLYLEDIWMFNEGTELSVANNFSKNKVFYCRHLYGRGTCTYADGYAFYKLINNKVYRCLELVNEANTCGWSPFLNQSIKMNFKFNGDNSDGLMVNYVYDFFYTPKDQSAMSESSDISLIKGDANVWYAWDTKTSTYKLTIPSYKKNIEDLTAEKIACFGDFKNDSLFVYAFRGQIDQTLKKGTSQQKKILKEICTRAKDRKALKGGEH
ncbi:hypothetical protein SAMN05216464_114130 [Mucilaginibacter pineti]|uniref:DKNYY family protein n=1 Tax=Mucilaginibacter pineti TaxID=1391627 RepID=A0A1G7JBL2_9SPHI|nr:hypothetical protein [Mucilaginibacter pineti]SDF22311.1 hypothetical protein SAMN05216464_114130 [Mucilaginibacter pineti]